MTINIHDVAKKAGVSPATVSRVINNNYPVKKETRDRVEKVIAELDYSPNILARGLIHNKTQTVGIIVPSINNLFFPNTVKAIEDILKKHNYTIYLCVTDNKVDEEEKAIKSLISRLVDGIIVIGPSTENIKNGFYEDINKRVSLVCINGFNKGVKLNFIINDQETGASEAIKYLIELGHKNIAFIRGHKTYSYDIKENIYHQLLDESKIQYRNVIDVGKGNSDETVDNTSVIMEEELKKSNITAIFACNDLMAIGALNACKKLNIKIPDEVSIIGFDNTVLSRFVEPKLTTVDMNMYNLGSYAAERLLEIIEKKDRNGNQKTILSSTLIKRNSCREIKR